MLHPASERMSQSTLRSATNNEMLVDPTLSAQVRRTCVQHCRSESVERSSRRSTRHSEHWNTQKEKTEDVFIWQILYNSIPNFYYVVLVAVRLVGHCCKPRPSVIIIIIIIKRSYRINADVVKQVEHQEWSVSFVSAFYYVDAVSCSAAQWTEFSLFKPCHRNYVMRT